MYFKMIDSWIFYAVPPEIGREILSFLNPISSPPLDIIRYMFRYRKWCETCGEHLEVSRTCMHCYLPTRYHCRKCITSMLLVTCPGPNNNFVDVPNPQEISFLGHLTNWINDEDDEDDDPYAYE